MLRLVLSIVLRILLVASLLVCTLWLLDTIQPERQWYEPVIAFLGTVYTVIEVNGNKDRFKTDPSLKSSPFSTNSNATIESYLTGRIIHFQEEERKFVKLAGKAVISPEYSTSMENFTDIDQVLDRFPSGFVLVGDPGAGKSTTLRHLERKYIGRYGSAPTQNRWPLWINLGLTSNPVKADELLLHWWQRHHLPGMPDEYLIHRPFVLLIDGLNEMPLDTRKDRAASLKAFLLSREPPISAIVTCRVDDYENELYLQLNLPIVHIEELDNDRIKEFLVKRDVAQMWTAIKNDGNLLSMARNPYKLAMLITVYDKSSNRLPTRVSELYRMYLKQTYKEYREERSKSLLTPLIQLAWKVLEEKLKYLAFKMLADGNGLSLQVDKARKCVGNKALIDGINMGVLRRDGDQIQFFHQSLHGYFAIEPLSRALSINNPFERITKNPAALIQQIGDLGENATPAVDALILALRNSDWRIRRNAAEALGKIGDVKATEVLITLLSDENSDVCSRAADALESIGQPAVDSLVKVLKNSKKPNIRIAVITILGHIGSSKAVDLLVHTLSDANPSISSSAVLALGDIGDPRAVEHLIYALVDINSNVSSSAAIALGKIGDPKTVAPLIRALEDNDGHVRNSAAWALGEIGDTQAVIALIRMLRMNRFNDTHNSIYEALHKIGTPAALEAIETYYRLK